MFLIPLIIIITIFLIRVQKGMFLAILFLISTKSIVDSFWYLKFGSLTYSSVSAIIIPIIFFPIFKRKNIFPNFWKNQSYLYMLALSFGLIWALPIAPLETFENILKLINIFLAFYMMPYLVNSRERLRKILLAVIIAGIFPMLISFFQYQTGIIFSNRSTVGLTRYVGLYHDAFPVRFYGLFTIFAVISYINLFRSKKYIIYALILIAIGSMFSVYLVFSKAATAIISFWIILLVLLIKSKFRFLFLSLFAFSALYYIFGDIFFSNFEQLFSKEIDYQSGAIKDSRYTLAGRGYIWEDNWNFWINEQILFFKLFGDGLSRSTHNEFLRIMMGNGIIGLLFYLVFLFRIIKYIFKSNKKVRVFSLMLFSMYFIDSIGLHTGNYFYYNILLWGFIGIFINRKKYIYS